MFENLIWFKCSDDRKLNLNKRGSLVDGLRWVAITEYGLINVQIDGRIIFACLHVERKFTLSRRPKNALHSENKKPIKGEIQSLRFVYIDSALVYFGVQQVFLDLFMAVYF